MKRLGTIDLRVEGVLIEKFINAALSSGILLYNTKRNGKNLLVRVSLTDFYRLRPVAKAAGCHIYINRRHGAASFVGSIRNRLMLLVGMALCVAAICFAQTRVFVISVTGDSGRDAMIMEELSKNGIYPGIAKSQINIPVLENEIISTIPEVAWVSMEIIGTKLKVEAAAASLPPDIIDRDTPSQLVANRDAVISSIETHSGTPQVKPGDTVIKGQLLIGGYERTADGLRAIRAMGNVKGAISFEGRGQATVYAQTRTPTGRKANVRSLRVGDSFFRIDDLPDFEHYDKTIKSYGFFLCYIVEEYLEVTPGLKEREAAEIKREALMLAEIDAYKQLPEGSEVVDKRVNFSMIDVYRLEAAVYVEAVIDIAEETE